MPPVSGVEMSVILPSDLMDWSFTAERSTLDSVQFSEKVKDISQLLVSALGVDGDLNQCGEHLAFTLCRFAAVFRALVVIFFWKLNELICIINRKTITMGLLYLKKIWWITKQRNIENSLKCSCLFCY